MSEADFIKMPPPPSFQGRPRTGPRGTGPRSRTAHQCCTHFPTVKCVKSNHCKFQRAGQPCTGSCPSENCCNAVHRNTSTLGRKRSIPAPTFTTNVKRNPTRLTVAQPTYCQVARLVAFHHNNPTFSPTASSGGGGGAFPRPVTAPPSRLRNSQRTRLPPPIQPQQ